MQRLRHWSTRHARLWAHCYRIGTSALQRWVAPLLRGVGVQRLERWALPIERPIKQLFFDCQMCGQCVLSRTGMTCPTNCGKQMRNGPCGGVRADGRCEVDATMPCVWVQAGDGDARIQPGHTPTWPHRLPPLESNQRGRSTWIHLVTPQAQAAPVLQPMRSSTTMQPPVSALERVCRTGDFIVTVEIAPPDSHDPALLLSRAARFRGLVDAINITDGAGANCHMSSVAAAAVLTAQGYEAVCQVSCRDRNRIALQGDVLGATALGVRNVLCLTGDDVSQGDQPGAKPVFDLDSTNLLHTLSGMAEQGQYASGRKLSAPVPMFLGATANPFVPPYAERLANLERKINAGARFIQTQFCFDLPMLDVFMREVRQRGLHERAAIIVGVGTLPTAKGLRWMAEHVPGVHVPEAVTRRIAAAADQKVEGLRICVETIHALRQIEGVAGVHLMGHKNEDTLARLIVEAGLRSPQAAVA